MKEVTVMLVHFGLMEHLHALDQLILCVSSIKNDLLNHENIVCRVVKNHQKK